MTPDQLDRRPRGMLLLVTLLMLALFMAIGAMLLTIALRSRSASRAAMDAGQPSSQSESLIREALDEALMAALRGARTGTNGSVTVSGTLENLLLDKYGPPLTTGSGAILSSPPAPTGTGSNTVVLPLSLTNLAPAVAQPARLHGRILTINPSSGGDATSFRILAATGSTCLMAQLPSTAPRPLPSGTFGVVINGREFTPEASGTTPESYDAYDDANLWLAQPALAGGQVSGTFPRLSFVGDSGTSVSTKAVVDNDNDGVPDGVWIPSQPAIDAAIASGSATPAPYVLADRPSPLGGTLRFQVSYLILDLDGRINVNAAGVAAAQGNYAGTPDVTIGMGYGPADLNVSGLFPLTVGGTATIVSGTPSPISLSEYWQDLLLTGTPTTTPVYPTTTQRRQPPLVGPIHGRYGPNAVPNGDGDQAGLGQRSSGTSNAILSLFAGSGESPYSLTLAGTNAVADLKAQTRVYMTPPSTGSGQLTPTLNFYRPTWTGTAGSDSIDDPYEVNLDLDAPRFGVPRRSSAAAGGNDDLPFTLAELERILRPNDADASQLPQRLAAGLEDQAQRNRFTITTDSWDTPGLTGLAARKVEDYLAGIPTPDPAAWAAGTVPASPEVAAGLRFDINRVVTGTDAASLAAARQEYCKGLYTLVMALGATNAAEAAQWAANVLDFRDADSTMTRFVYDTNLADGWQVNGSSPVVYGAERPEVVITETGAWVNGATGQLFIVLHRPAAQAQLMAAASGSASAVGVAEASSAALGAGGVIDLAKTHNSNASGSPVWRLTFGANKVVQFGEVGNPPAAGVHGSGAAAASLPLAANGYLCVCPTSPQRFTPAVSQFNIDRPSAAAFRADDTVVSLERLADPEMAFNATTNPYVPVDIARVNEVDVSAPEANVSKLRRAGPSDVAAGAQNNANYDSEESKRRHALFWKNGRGNPTATVWAGEPELVWQTETSSSLGAYTGASQFDPVPRLHWPNRPFIGNAELALVPTGTSSTAGMLGDYSFPTNSLVNSGLSVSVNGTTTTLGLLLLDATTVPSRFAGNAMTVPGTAMSAVGLDRLGVNQLSRWREPGRVNVNTIVLASTYTGATVASWSTLTPPSFALGLFGLLQGGGGGGGGGGGVTYSTDDLVWQTVIGSTYTINPWLPSPAASNTIPAVPAQPATPSTPHRPAIPAIPGRPTKTPASPAISDSQVLTLSSTSGVQIASEDFATSVSGTMFPLDKNPYFSLARVIRLSNTTTVRSNVFAIWITVKVTDDSPNAPSPVTKRLFAIVDRSIPVGYRHNRDLNVRDTIKVKRHLD